MNGSADLSNVFGITMLCVFAAAIVTDCLRDIRQLVSSRNVFLLTLLAWYLLEATIIPDELIKYVQQDYNFGVICVMLSGICFLTGYSTTKGGIFDGVFHRLNNIDRPGTIWLVFLISLFVGFLPLVVIAKGNVLLILEEAFTRSTRWSSIFQRGRFGGARDAFLELQMFLRAALPLAAVVLMQPKQRPERRFIALLVLVYMVSRALNDGTRSKAIEALMPVLAAVYWRLSAPLKKTALTFGLPTLVMAGILWAAATVAGRNSGDFQWEDALDRKYVGFEMFRELLFLNKAIPANSDYQFGHTYFVQLVNPVPRFLWPDKPIGDSGLMLAELQQAVTADGTAYLTVSPGLLGEMHWNFGLPGIAVISWILGYFAKSWDRVRVLARQSLLAFTVFAAGLAIIFMSGRSLNMATLYGMLSLFGMLIFFSSRRRKQVPGFKPVSGSQNKN